ncbi:hypothetical protein M0P65_02855 [Candidatus Gracilibacteria bacterium]|nr:hypothetical protein [Candidatus Gracilibacteria bacterium]
MQTCLNIPDFPNEEVKTLGQIYALRAGVCAKTCEVLLEGEEKYFKLILKGMWPEVIILCDEIISKINNSQSPDFDRYLLETWENRKSDAYEIILENLLSE